MPIDLQPTTTSCNNNLYIYLLYPHTLLLFEVFVTFLVIEINIGVQKPGPQYSPAIYTMDIAYKIDIPLYIFDRYITGI